MDCANFGSNPHSLIDGIIQSLKSKNKNFEIYNLGNQHPVKLMYVLKLLEINLKKKAKIIFTDYKKAEMLKTHSSNKKSLKWEVPHRCSPRPRRPRRPRPRRA